ncbi:PD-(D/E)XK nuclease-like domain-containing protein [uncultured Photobacterium sp.]|uniref:PD-(D/E)XK nuclease-like domain-containing protein n=1 Tax=uncultured Photobacterium sp. TaxID=173973 RepID=UPI0026237D00|nr:PD-(D/E)XK nuclease-like domain-containing protein [uncultured Photobacterium sp.]
MAAQTQVSSSMTSFRFSGCQLPVMKAYDDSGNPTWLDSNDELVEGIYIGMENEIYHALPAYSSSQIKTLVKKSPAHFYREYISDVSRKRKSVQLQRTLDAGTYGHELILEPHGFYDRYYRDLVEADVPEALTTAPQMRKKCEELGIPIPKSADKARCKKELKAADSSLVFFDEIKEAHVNDPKHQNKTAIDGIVYDDAHRVLESCRNNRIADALVQNGLPEISFIAKCPRTGMWLKCRFDWLRFDCIAVDVKTTASTAPEAFAKQAGTLGYFIQEAFYRYVAALLGVQVSSFIFLCVEYVDCDWCEVYELDGKEEAMHKCLSALDTLKHCLATNEWRAYSQRDTIRTLSIPNFAR